MLQPVLVNGGGATPVFVISGIIIDHSLLSDFTRDFISIKQRFYNRLVHNSSRHLDKILKEIKGSEIRKQIRIGGRKKIRHAFGVIDSILALLEKYNVKIIGKVLIKSVSYQNYGRGVYTSSIQSLCDTFQNHLLSCNGSGVMILDSRNQNQNVQVSHSIFTKKFKSSGDDYPNIAELPVFCHSNNHSGIQVSDIINSALIFPLATLYCVGHINNIHVSSNFSRIKTRYGVRLMRLQHRYQDISGQWRGGIVVNDTLNKRSGSIFFK